MANLQEPPNSKKVRISASNDQMLLRQNPPDLCLDAIYRHIPLEHLLLDSTELISNSWYLARTRALAKRQTLYLIHDVYDSKSEIDLWNSTPYRDNVHKYIKQDDGSPLIKRESWDQLKFDAVLVPSDILTVTFTSYLLNKLSKITQLAVLAGGIDTQELEQVIRLLEHHSAHLVKLHLSLGNYTGEEIAPQAITRLFETINRLAALEHLKLNLYFTGEHERPPLSILSRLTSFLLDSRLSLHYVVDSNWLISSLGHYANSATLRSISCDGLCLKQLARLDSQIVRKFNWLHETNEYDEQIEFVQMVQLFSHFNSLTCLQMELRLPINMLARCLAQVPSLVNLNLAILEITPEPGPNEGEPVIRHQVPSLLALSLYITVGSHDDVISLHIADTFPRLQVIQIEHEVEKCRSCNFKPKLASLKRVFNCRRLARELLIAGCHNLLRIIYESEDPDDDDDEVSFHHEDI